MNWEAAFWFLLSAVTLALGLWLTKPWRFKRHKHHMRLTHVESVPLRGWRWRVYRCRKTKCRYSVRELVSNDPSYRLQGRIIKK